MPNLTALGTWSNLPPYKWADLVAEHLDDLTDGAVEFADLDKCYMIDLHSCDTPPHKAAKLGLKVYRNC